jgi:hypothetical protein
MEFRGLVRGGYRVPAEREKQWVVISPKKRAKNFEKADI